ncbi:MAG: glycogen-binding domain-containing protein [Verrucomicrobiales bacterium]|nr:glycogen-binding domain-containing protein [Verrucomicrobiales bacterium]
MIKAPKRRMQEFRFRSPTALAVQLVGDFTRWGAAPLALSKGTDGVWRVAVDLEPGTHRYRFLVDGEWGDEPECTLRVPVSSAAERGERSMLPAS